MSDPKVRCDGVLFNLGLALRTDFSVGRGVTGSTSGCDPVGAGSNPVGQPNTDEVVVS